MKIRYAIIENEEYARINLENIIKAVRPGYELGFVAETVSESISFFSQPHDIGLVFMDIELDDGSCFDIFANTDLHLPVIFTTAYDKYAIKAFKVNSIDYILKPLIEDDITNAISKFEKNNLRSCDYRRMSEDYSSLRTRTRILVSDGNGYSFVHTDDIAWFEAEDKYVVIKLKNGKSILSEQTSLDDTALILDTEKFFRVSRAVIASIGSISRVRKYFKGRLQVELSAGTEKRTETMSAARRPGFLSWLGQM